MTIIITSCVSDNVENSVLSETTISSIENSRIDKSEMKQLQLVALTGKTKIPLEEAKKLALYTAQQMRKEEGIVTKAPLEFEKVEIIKDGIKKEYVKTKGEEEKGDLYLLNFKNNQGYVLTSADRRVPGVFAYNSQGYLGDTIYNPGEAIALEGIESYIKRKKEEFNKNRLKLAVVAQEELFKKLTKEEQEELIKKGLFDKNGKRIITKSYDDDCFKLPNNDDYESSDRTEVVTTETPWVTTYLRKPMVKTLWSQSGGIYNKDLPNCFFNKSKKYKVGCVAVAVGQIMGFHKKPNVFKGRTLDWEAMTKVKKGKMFSNIYDRKSTSSAVKDIQHLLAKLGDDDLLKMEYGCKSSGTDDEDALRTFHKLGYSANLEEYSTKKAIEEIKNNRVVYVSGYSTSKTILGLINWAENGHAWVLDGYVKKTQKVTVTIHDECMGDRTWTDNISMELVHSNFGWGGNLNGSSKSRGTGWYHKGVFNANVGPKETSNTYKSDTRYYYRYDRMIITNIQ